LGGTAFTKYKLQWGHADGGVEGISYVQSHLLPRNRFNGATPMVAWKARIVMASLTVRSELQWGHADGGVEGDA